MPVKPHIKTLTNSSIDILNAIRNSATTNYQEYVPIATPNAESLREIGTIIMDSPNLQNEFLNALVNRIGRVIVTSKLYDNPLKMFKKGVLEFGETIEEIFVNIAKPYQYDTSTAEQTVFKREIPDVRSAFHIMNYQKYYKVTIQNEQLRQAFLSWDGVTNLIAKITESMYTSANYDEFQVIKYLLARHILNGTMHTETINDNLEISKKVSAIKAVSNKFTFPRSDYNLAGVINQTDKQNQYILVNADFEAEMSVEVLATAFNMDKAEFIGHEVLVDGFGDIDIKRLNELFDGDTTYIEISQAELDALNKIPAVLVDENFFMIYDNMIKFTEIYNGEGLYWNYWLHTWKTFSVSPFANNTVFVPATPTVVSVTVKPSTVTLTKNSTFTFTANVTTTDFASQAVNWTVDSDKATISSSGMVTILDTATAGDTITVTATSVYDPTKKGEGVITIA